MQESQETTQTDKIIEKVREEKELQPKQEGKQREFSASMLTTLFGCSLAFYFKYISHEKVPQPSRLAFGRAIHYLLKLFYDKNFVSADSFVKFWRGYWYREKAYVKLLDDRGKPVKDEEGRVVLVRDSEGWPVLNPEIEWRYLQEPHTYARLGSSILRRFYTRHIGKPRPLVYEKDFRKVELRGHLLRGTLDRIDETPNGIFITDYKTDRASPIKDTFILHRHPQFTIYSWAFRRKFGKTENVILFYHLRSGRVIKTKRNQEDFDYLSSLADKAQGIIDRQDYTPFYSFHCGMCEYRNGPCSRTAIGVGAKLKQMSLEDRIIPAEEWLDWSEER